MRFFGIGMQELLVIFFICLLVFGANRLPEIGRSLGKTISEFKKSLKEGLSEADVKPDSDNSKKS